MVVVADTVGLSPATDAGAFAARLLGQPLWDHQLELVRSPARYRVVCAGRQVGKSRALAVLALHEAATKRDAMVLLVSAGDTASKRLLEECAALAAASPLLRGSVLDESKSQLTLSNGSRILSVPASQRQIRGWSVDLLILDEAAFIDSEIWRAAEPSIVARPGSRVVLCSTPWGSVDHFFRQLWRRGMDAPDGMVSSWHWPSSVSPLVDDVLLEHWRETWPAREFATEVMAEWVDDSGAYFSSADLEAAATVETLVGPEDGASLGSVVGGVDWGFARDANTLAVLAARPGLDERGRTRFWVPYVAERFGLAYDDWIDELVGAARGFRFSHLVCEANGVGAMPAQVLAKRFAQEHLSGVVDTVWTTAQLKENAFGWARVLLQQRRLELPREPALLKQLRALEFEATPTGGLRIAVPERAGHDDLAMALCLALSGAMGDDLPPVDEQVYDVHDLLGEDWEYEDEALGWAPGSGGGGSW